MTRRRDRLVVLIALAMAGAVVVWGASRAVPWRVDAATGEVRIASVPSCKPSPTVQVTLEPGPTPDVWRVRLEAREAAGDVVVEIGARAGERETRGLHVWRGDLEAGSRREIEARLEPGVDATSVWVTSTAASSPGSVVRSMASVGVAGGQPVARAEATPSSGRLVTDPRTGETVLEFQGATATATEGGR